jgi:hypothetical protein
MWTRLHYPPHHTDSRAVLVTSSTWRAFALKFLAGACGVQVRVILNGTATPHPMHTLTDPTHDITTHEVTA